MPGFSTCLIFLDIWHSFEYASDIKYAGVLNILRYICSKIIIVTNFVILEFLSVRFVDAGPPELTILIFQHVLEDVMIMKANELLNLTSLNEIVFLKYFFSWSINTNWFCIFLTTMMSELSKYLNEQLGVFLNVKQ